MTKAAAFASGTITLSENGDTLGTVQLDPNTGAASLQVTTLKTVGVHTLVATYSGDANYAPSTQSYVHSVVVVPVATPVPTLSEWAVVALSALLALFGVTRMRRRFA